MHLEDFEEFPEGLRHSASGRYILPMTRKKQVRSKRLFKKNKVKQEKVAASPRTDEKDDTEKGFILEDLFEGMANLIVRSRRVSGIIGVRRSSYDEDHIDKIDFWLDIKIDQSHLHSIAVQVKSSWRGAYEFMDEYADLFPWIHLVVMDERVDQELLIRILQSIINTELRLLRQNTPTF
jgi:hypothetical protein